MSLDPLERTEAAEGRPASGPTADSVRETPIKILIVDDEPKNLTVLETVLNDPTYQLVRAESGDQALRTLLVEDFALLILDICMPGMSGFELAKTIKERKKTARIPIIFLTAYYNDDQHVLEGYDSGAVDYLHKPVNAAILRAKVSAFVELHRMQRDIAISNRALLAEVAERRRAEERLRRLSETLDQRVLERTLELREKEHFLARITEVLPGVLHVFDLEKQSTIFFSRPMAVMLGYSAQESQAMGSQVLSTLRHPDDEARFAEHLRRVSRLRDGESLDFEYRLRSRSGDYVWFRSRDTVFRRTADGAVQQVISAAFDVTVRKGLEDAMRQSEERFRTMAEGLPHCVWVCDAAGAFEYHNGYWYDYTGLSPDVDARSSWLDRCHEDDRRRFLQEWRAALRSQEPFDAEGRLRHRDGKYRWFRIRASPIRDGRGTTVRWVGTCSDIHEQRMLLETLVETDRRKDEFLATLAHELRSPLAPVRNAVQLLQMSAPAAPEQQWARDIIDRQTLHLTRLIDDLMDVSRISCGRIELKRERVEISKVVQAAVEASRPLIEERGHKLTVTQSPGRIVIDGDSTRLTQVLVNLLNNAAKYTEGAGAIHLRVERQGSDVLLSVRDTGIGIPAEKLGSIFEMFSQVEPALSRSQGGLGIGLFLTKQLAELHGGTIEARSEGPGKGSEFVVRLPIVVEQSTPVRRSKDSEPALATSGLRILVADDNRDAADALTRLFRVMGNHVRTVYDGAEVFAVARDFHPDVVLCDIGMPVLNGYEACRRIRQEPWGADMILIAVTGWGQDDDNRRALAAGFDRHLTKPVEWDALMGVLSELGVAKART